MPEIEITKVVYCQECAELKGQGHNPRSPLYYAGASKISPTITLVAFRCEFGHHTKTETDDATAQQWIKAQKKLAHNENERRERKRRDDEHRAKHGNKPGIPENVTAPGRTAG